MLDVDSKVLQFGKILSKVWKNKEIYVKESHVFLTFGSLTGRLENCLKSVGRIEDK